MNIENINKHNEALKILSQELFGESMGLQIVNPKQLVLLKDNARYFKRETFRQLRDNIAADKRLSSVPLCYQHENGSLEVLSGNHRVKACLEAKIEYIMILVITEKIESSKRIAIQLSHNALIGEDDQSILANLWSQIESVQDKLYSGLDSETMQELGEVKLINFSTPQISAHVVSFMFTDGESEQLSEIIDVLNNTLKTSSSVYIGNGEQFNRFMTLIKDIKDVEKIRDSSLAILRIIEICQEWLENQNNQQKEK